MALRIARLPVWKIIVPFLLLVSVVIILSSFYVFNTAIDINGRKSGELAITVAVIGSVITVISLFTIMTVRLRIIRSIDKLTVGVSLISEGYLDHRVTAISRDETLDLSNAFNQMAATISETVHSLSSERNTLSALLDTMADGVIVTDEEGKITLLNKTAQLIFNLENSEYLDLRLADVIRDFEIIQMASDCVDIGESIQDEIEVPEVRRYLSVTATPIGSGSGGGVLITVHDLTNIRQLENTRKEFVSNVSHELRSPLASVKAMVGTLENGALEDKKAATDFIIRIDKDVDRMTSLVSDLLELSRLESGQEDIELEPVELRSLVEDAISMITNQVIGAPEISCKIFENVEILGNKQKITQILINLLQNSVKFTPAEGTISVETKSNGGFVEVSVLDSGIGIAAEHLPHLFERFYKVDKARRDGGTGLGLAIVKHIVQAHGGAVYADSVEGEGSAFHFTLPLLNTASIENFYG
ncbi:MAG: ATP-binding protein [Dehalococcoidia bacterium]